MSAIVVDNTNEASMETSTVQPANWNSDVAAIADQPTPAGTGLEIAPLVIADIEARARLGEHRYGERLRAHNGRDALIDAYQEALDLAIYLRQLLEEQRVAA